MPQFVSKIPFMSGSRSGNFRLNITVVDTTLILITKQKCNGMNLVTQGEKREKHIFQTFILNFWKRQI